MSGLILTISRRRSLAIFRRLALKTMDTSVPGGQTERAHRTSSTHSGRSQSPLLPLLLPYIFIHFFPFCWACLIVLYLVDVRACHSVGRYAYLSPRLIPAPPWARVVLYRLAMATTQKERRNEEQGKREGNI